MKGVSHESLKEEHRRCRAFGLTASRTTRRRFWQGWGRPWHCPGWRRLADLALRSSCAGGGPPKRFIGFFVPNGFNMASFGRAELVPSMRICWVRRACLRLVCRSDILLINGLDNHAGSAQGAIPVTMPRHITFLTCAHPFKHASQLRVGPSVDHRWLGTMKPTPFVRWNSAARRVATRMSVIRDKLRL